MFGQDILKGWRHIARHGLPAQRLEVSTLRIAKPSVEVQQLRLRRLSLLPSERNAVLEEDQLSLERSNATNGKALDFRNVTAEMAFHRLHGVAQEPGPDRTTVNGRQQSGPVGQPSATV